MALLTRSGFIYFLIDQCRSLISHHFASLTTCKSFSKQKLVVDYQGATQLTLAIIEEKLLNLKRNVVTSNGILWVCTVTFNLMVLLNCAFIYG